MPCRSKTKKGRERLVQNVYSIDSDCYCVLKLAVKIASFVLSVHQH